MQRPLWGLLRALWIMRISILLLPQDTVGFLCSAPPNITHGYNNATESTYDFGTVITYTCNEGFFHAGAHSIYCDISSFGIGLWKESIPICKEVKCKVPLVEHGLLVSGFGNTSYKYGNTVTFECKIGYYLVGNYLIKCGQNHSWYPAPPSCKKIDPEVCGAPLIPSGTVRPLRHQYYIGTIVAVVCNKQYSFPDETMEMNVECQGYNSWFPPVQACFSRTSPDIYHLTIPNGKIIRGKKRSYEPGDVVTIRCSPGYTLSGPPEIRYIGGKRWSPKLPSCSLSFVFILLIAAILKRLLR